jgi:hypothetical protein
MAWNPGDPILLDNSGKLPAVDGSQLTGIGGGAGVAPPRSVVYTVAASDATAAEIAQADLTCDGTNDEVQIEAADAVAAGGIVQLSTGTFCIDADLDLDNYSIIRGHGGATTLELASNTESVIMSGFSNFSVGNKLWDLEIKAPASFTGDALLITPAGAHFSSPDVLKNVVVYCGAKAFGATCTQTGKGVKILCDGNSHALALCNLSNVHVWGFQYGLYIDVQETNAETGAYVNSCTFENWVFNRNDYMIYLTTSENGSPLIVGNNFVNCYFQYHGSCTAGIYIDDNGTGSSQIYKNYFTNMYFWDFAGASDHIYVATGNAYNNYFEGGFSMSRVDGTQAKYQIYAPRQLYYGNYGMQLPLYPYADLYSNGTWVYAPAGENITVGQLCRWDASDGEFYGTDADAFATTEGTLGICMDSSLADGDLGRFLLNGSVRKDTHGFVDEPIVVSETKFGICGVDELGASSFMRVVGYPWDSDNWIFNPSPDIFELTAGGAVTKVNGLSIDDGD